MNILYKLNLFGLAPPDIHEQLVKYNARRLFVPLLGAEYPQLFLRLHSAFNGRVESVSVKSVNSAFDVSEIPVAKTEGEANDFSYPTSLISYVEKELAILNLSTQWLTEVLCELILLWDSGRYSSHDQLELPPVFHIGISKGWPMERWVAEEVFNNTDRVFYDHQAYHPLYDETAFINVHVAAFKEHIETHIENRKQQFSAKHWKTQEKAHRLNEHLYWMLRYQVFGDSHSEIAYQYMQKTGKEITDDAVSKALRRTAKLLDLELRSPAKGGQPKKPPT